MQITTNNSSSYNLAQQHGGIQKTTIEQEVLQICFETLKKVYEHSTVYLA